MISHYLGYPFIKQYHVQMMTQIAKLMGPTWGPPGSCRPQMGPMLAPWTLLSGEIKFMSTSYEIVLMNVTELLWWYVKIGSGNGLLLSGYKPLLEPDLSPYGTTTPQWVKPINHVKVYPLCKPIQWIGMNKSLFSMMGISWTLTLSMLSHSMGTKYKSN